MAAADPAAADRWELDPHFGAGGIVSTDFPGAGHRYAWGYDSAVQPDGRIVVAGSPQASTTMPRSRATGTTGASTRPSVTAGG